MGDEEARSTDRPPAPDEETARDLSAAIRAARNASPGRYGPPQATAKMGAFDLAQALALSSADGDPMSSKPPRDDDAPFVAGEVEVVGEVEVPSGVPVDPPAKSAPPRAVLRAPPIPMAMLPRVRPSYTGLVLVALLVGLAVIAYAYVTANR